MGTRGVIGYILRNGTRKGSYVQFDSYPEGMGLDIQKFLLTLNQEDMMEMRRLVEAIIWVDNDKSPVPIDCELRYREYGLSDTSDVSWPWTRWNSVLWETQGARTLPAVKSIKLKHLLDQAGFVYDGLYCEWAYFIDFWNEKLEIWSGGAVWTTLRFQRLRDDPTLMSHIVRYDESE
ncbi:hypothetical protein IAT38_000164 [Cryptococcus sp. DSM 104549]